MLSRIDKETAEQLERFREEAKQQPGEEQDLYIAFLESEVKRLTDYSNKLMRDRVKLVNLMEQLG